ncbi:MAG: hypothetical protein V7L23_30000 [Nostoc sp.]
MVVLSFLSMVVTATKHDGETSRREETNCVSAGFHSLNFDNLRRDKQGSN